jgi:hypothetical protein
MTPITLAPLHTGQRCFSLLHICTLSAFSLAMLWYLEAVGLHGRLYRLEHVVFGDA